MYNSILLSRFYILGQYVCKLRSYALVLVLFSYRTLIFDDMRKFDSPWFSPTTDYTLQFVRWFENEGLTLHIHVVFCIKITLFSINRRSFVMCDIPIKFFTRSFQFDQISVMLWKCQYTEYLFIVSINYLSILLTRSKFESKHVRMLTFERKGLILPIKN